MSKKNFLNKIKDASMAIPKSVNSIKTSTVQKAKNLYQQTNAKQIFEKTKGQLNQKTQTLKNYAGAIRQATQYKASQIKNKSNQTMNSASQSLLKLKQKVNVADKKETLTQYTQKFKQNIQSGQKTVAKTAQNIFNQANNLKDKIKDANIVNQKKQVISQYASKLKSDVKQKGQSISKNVGNLLKSTIQIKDKKKQQLIQYAQKIKDGAARGKQKITKKTQKLIQSTANTKDQVKKLVNSVILKQQKQLQPSKRIGNPIKQMSKKYLTFATPKQQPKQPKPGISPSIFSILIERGNKLHERFFSNYIISNSKKTFLNMLGSIYWRIVFGACLIVFVYGVSVQLPRQLRLHYSEKRKQQRQSERLKNNYDKVK